MSNGTTGQRIAVMRRGVAVLAVTILACGSDPAGSGDGALRILFVGNSLTYANDLPDMLHRLGTADGLTLEPSDVSQGGYALEDHWATPASRAALDEGGWDIVILQQGPSSLPASRENLVTWARTWADAIRARGGTPALYMVWPERARLNVLDDVILSYRTAAEEADAELYAAGEAWKAAWNADPDLPLYGDDDFHPSVMGTYLAALTIYRGVTGRAPPSLGGLGISAEDDAILQAAAREASAAAAASATPR
jgi:hypothetical protein